MSAGHSGDIDQLEPDRRHTPLFRLTSNSIFYIAFLSYVVSHIAKFLFNAQNITSNVIYGAVCLYLILGLIWTFLYFLVLLYDPAAIKLDALKIGGDPGQAMVELLYFSYVTMTTLGYGDITPLSRLAQSLAILQAFLGQIYLAVVIASLVGMQISSSSKSTD